MKRIAHVVLIVGCVLLIAHNAAKADVSFSGLLGVTFGTAGRTPVMKTGALVTTATTADQVALTYTVTAGKSLYLQYHDAEARLTTFAATATSFGNCSIESPAGTKLYTQMYAGAGVSQQNVWRVTEPVAIAAGTVVRVVCTPAAATSMTWQINLGGYER